MLFIPVLKKEHVYLSNIQANTETECVCNWVCTFVEGKIIVRERKDMKQFILSPCQQTDISALLKDAHMYRTDVITEVNTYIQICTSQTPANMKSK